MALTVIGSSVEVRDGAGGDTLFTFIPDSTWHTDDLLCAVIALAGSSPTIASISDTTGGDRTAWHYQATAGTAKMLSNQFTYYTLWFRMPPAMDGTNTHIDVAVTVGGTVTKSVVLPGQAIRGAKRVHSRHCATGTSDTHDYNIPSAGASPKTATLPSHVPGTNVGTAGALEFAVGDLTQSTAGIVASVVFSMPSGTVLDSTTYDNWSGTSDLWLGSGYRLWSGANTPVTESAATMTASGWVSGSVAPNIQRFMFVFDANIAPSAAIQSATDLGGKQAEAVVDAFDYEASQDATGIYPEPTAVIDWGDGYTTSLPLTNGSLNTMDHTYAGGGTYTLTVTATDEDGATGVATMDLVVAGEPVSDGTGPYTYVPTRVDIQELPHSVHTGML